MGETLRDKISIMANPYGNFWNFSINVHKHVYELVERNCDQNPNQYVELTPLKATYFPDGEYTIEADGNVRGRHCFLLMDNNLESSIWSKQVTMNNQALRKAWAGKITTMGLLWKWARQDRKLKSREPISSTLDLKSIDHPIASTCAIELHNMATEGVVDMPFANIPFFVPMSKELRNHDIYLEDEWTFGGVDKGSVDRNGKYISALGMLQAHIDKERTIEGKLGKSQGVLGIENVKKKNVMIYDDLWATGGSLSQAIKAYKNAGAERIIVAIAHPQLLNGFLDIPEQVDRIFFGNAIKLPLIPGEGVYLSDYAIQGQPKNIRDALPKDRPTFVSDLLRLQEPYKSFKLPENVINVNLESSVGDFIYQTAIEGSVSDLYKLKPNGNNN